jgi:hypothetical protein
LAEGEARRIDDPVPRFNHVPFQKDSHAVVFASLSFPAYPSIEIERSLIDEIVDDAYVTALRGGWRPAEEGFSAALTRDATRSPNSVESTGLDPFDELFASMADPKEGRCRESNGW